MCWQVLSTWFILSLGFILWPEVCVAGLCVCKPLCRGVVRQEGPLRCTGPHGKVGVHQQVGEAGGEVGDKVIRDGAQSLLHLSRQLSVMVFLLKEGQALGLKAEISFF